MPPFLPNIKLVPGAKLVPLGKLTMSSKHSHSVRPGPAKKTKGSKEHAYDDRYRQSDDVLSQAGTTTSQQTYNPRMMHNNHNHGTEHQWQEGELRSSQPRYDPQNFSVEQMTERTFAMDLASIAQVPLYEHIFKLRQHGISVKLGRETIRIIHQQGPVRQQSTQLKGNIGVEAMPVNIHDPSLQEIHAIDQSINVLLSRGAELDFSGLDPVHSCSVEQLKDLEASRYHSTRAQHGCQYCHEEFSHPSLLDHHVVDEHKIKKHRRHESGYGNGQN